MLNYIIGFFKNITHQSILHALVDKSSFVSRKSRLGRGVKIFHSKVGDYTYIGKNTSLVYATVGKFCSIAGNSSIGMANHTLSCLSTSPIFTEKNNGTGYTWTMQTHECPYKPVKVGNDVWIGTKAMVLGGVEIGNGAVIAAGAVVTRNVPPYAVVAGVPARIIKYRFPNEIISELEKIEWWSLPDEVLKKHINLFQTTDVTLDLIKNLSHE